jgi:hypothetical protein
MLYNYNYRYSETNKEKMKENESSLILKYETGMKERNVYRL